MAKLRAYNGAKTYKKRWRKSKPHVSSQKTRSEFLGLRPGHPISYIGYVFKPQKTGRKSKGQK